MTIKSKLIAFVALILLTGCNPPELSKLPANATILAFGDSLTVGVGVNQEESYPAILQALTGLRVHGAGVSGEVTQRGMERFTKVLNQTTPNLVILLEGGNDILRNVRPAEIKSNLSSMIEMAQAQGAQVVLIGVPEKNLFSNVAPLYEELAAEHQVVLMDSIISKLLRSSKYKSDPVHFNAAGYRRLAEEVHATLRSAGALQ